MTRSLFSRLSQRFDSSAPSRRAVLSAAAAAGAGMLLSGCAAGGRSNLKPVNKRVIVVGAGLAGLACGYELRQAGYDVNLFEAHQRLGGRVWSVGDFLPGQILEAGGEFLGLNQPTWAAYRQRFELELTEVAHDPALSRPILIDGKQLDDAQARTLFEKMRAAYARLVEEAGTVNAEEPWKTPDAQTLDMRTLTDWLAGQNISPLCRRAITADLEGTDNTPLNRQSYLAKLAQIKGGGLEKYFEQSWSHRCKGGAQQLAAKLARAIGTERIQLGRPIVSIQSTKGMMLVATADGKTFEADDVVLAVPPSVWKKIQIYPELPAVLRIQMGSAVKCLVSVKDASWLMAGQSPNAFTDGVIGRTWSPPTPRNATEHALIAFSGGPAADAARRLDPDTREAAYLAHLQPLFPGIGHNFKAARFIDWPADPWTLAGYSFPAPGDLTTAGPILRSGLGSLHFAGEHASPSFAGTMEGALSSGTSLAKRLAVRDGAIEM